MKPARDDKSRAKEGEGVEGCLLGKTFLSGGCDEDLLETTDTIPAVRDCGEKGVEQCGCPQRSHLIISPMASSGELKAGQNLSAQLPHRIEVPRYPRILLNLTTTCCSPSLEGVCMLYDSYPAESQYIRLFFHSAFPGKPPSGCGSLHFQSNPAPNRQPIVRDADFCSSFTSR